MKGARSRRSSSDCEGSRPRAAFWLPLLSYVLSITLLGERLLFGAEPKQGQRCLTRFRDSAGAAFESDHRVPVSTRREVGASLVE